MLREVSCRNYCLSTQLHPLTKPLTFTSPHRHENKPLVHESMPTCPTLNCSQQHLSNILIELDKISDGNTAAEFSECNFGALWAPHAHSHRGPLHSRQRSDIQSRYQPLWINNMTVSVTNTQHLLTLRCSQCGFVRVMDRWTNGLSEKKKNHTHMHARAHRTQELEHEYFAFEKTFTWLWKSSVGEK